MFLGEGEIGTSMRAWCCYCVERLASESGVLAISPTFSFSAEKVVNLLLYNLINTTPKLHHYFRHHTSCTFRYHMPTRVLQAKPLTPVPTCRPVKNRLPAMVAGVARPERRQPSVEIDSKSQVSPSCRSMPPRSEESCACSLTILPQERNTNVIAGIR